MPDNPQRHENTCRFSPAGEASRPTKELSTPHLPPASSTFAGPFAAPALDLLSSASSLHLFVRFTLVDGTSGAALPVWCFCRSPLTWHIQKSVSCLIPLSPQELSPLKTSVMVFKPSRREWPQFGFDSCTGRLMTPKLVSPDSHSPGTLPASLK